MCETSAQAHVLPVLKSVISGVAVTLEVSFERFQKIDRHLLRTRSVGIMEEEQARHRRSYYPDILLCRLMPVMVYDRENMPEEYGSCEDNAWVRYIQSRVLRELDISPRRWKQLTSWPRRKGSSAYEPSCARLRISMRNGIAAWPPISPRAAAAPLKPSVPPIAKALQKRKEIDHGILF